MKDVKGFEGRYAVDRDGNIYSHITKKWLKPQKRGKYHYNQLFTKDGEMMQLSIHRIVAMVYLDNPENKPCINHKDGNPINNSVDNLEWVTWRENTIHAHKSGLWNADHLRGENSYRSKLTEDQVKWIRRNEGNMSRKGMAEYFGVTEKCIYKIHKRITWKHI